MSKRVYLASLGCPKNQVDAEVMLGGLAREGYELTLDPDGADVVLVNTCAFIGPAKEESIQTILELGGRKTGEQRLVVTGCLAERYAKDLREELPEVDAFVGTGDFLRLSAVLRDAGVRAPDGRAPAYVGAQHVLPDASAPRILTDAWYSAYVKVSEGCDHDCAFCIIPKIRGRHESRSSESIVAEVTRLAEEGVREVNLIAQDLTAWGRDLPEKRSLASLLRELDRIPGVDWIRLLYCYPNSVTDELLGAVAELPRVCAYLDLPLQHGSDRMLKAMRRGHTGDSLRRLVGRIRDRVPGVALRTSFIVGFPGETDEDFAALRAFVSDLEFDRVGVFRYSQEENTAAGVMPGQVPEPVKEERWHELMGLQRAISERKNQGKIGTLVAALACGVDEEGPYGRTEGQAPEIDGVVRLSEELELGDLVPVRVTGADAYDLFAEPAGVDRPFGRP